MRRDVPGIQRHSLPLPAARCCRGAFPANLKLGDAVLTPRACATLIFGDENEMALCDFGRLGPSVRGHCHSCGAHGLPRCDRCDEMLDICPI